MKSSQEPAGLKQEFVVPEQQSTLPGVTNGDSYMYLHINEDVPCFAGEDSYYNKHIVKEIASKKTRVEQSPASEPMATHTIASPALSSRASAMTLMLPLMSVLMSSTAEPALSFKHTTLNTLCFIGLALSFVVITS